MPAQRPCPKGIKMTEPKVLLMKMKSIGLQLMMSFTLTLLKMDWVKSMLVVKDFYPEALISFPTKLLPPALSPQRLKSSPRERLQI
nr:hypothetical protein I308_04879 [Cryptococcus tetragattii IND107]